MEPKPIESSATVRRRFVHRIRENLHWKLPGVFADPNFRERVANWSRRDTEKNAKVALPDDELVDLRCIWGIEFYTPAHIEQLLSGLKKLGWDQNNVPSESNNPYRWLQRRRETPHVNSGLNLGTIRRPGTKVVLGHPRIAPLPEHVDSADGEMFTVTPSITCIVICFVFDEIGARRLDHVVRRSYKTVITPHGTGYSISDPIGQKSDAVRNFRAEIRSIASSWFREYLPGLFSSGVLREGLPTCEFVTLRKSEPFPQRAQTGAQPPPYLDVLDLAFGFDSWFYSDIPGLKFAWALRGTDEEEFHAVLTANENAFSGKDLNGFAGHLRLSQIAYLHENMTTLLGRWALLAGLTGFERHLSVVRDSAALRPVSRGQSKKALELLTRLISQSVDIATISSELVRYMKPHSLFDHEMMEFKPSEQWRHRNPDITVGKALQAQIAARSSLLHDTDHSVRDLVTQYGAFLGTLENIRLQKQIGCFTILILLFTVATVLFAAENSRIISYVWYWISGLFA